MNRVLTLVVSTTLAAALAACGESTATNTGNPDTGGSAPEGIDLVRSSLEREEAELGETQGMAFGESSRDFALDLYGQIRGEDGNLFISPYSISTALAMLYAGAKGETKSEMMSALHFDLPEPDLHAAFNATERALSGREDELYPGAGADQGLKLSVVNAAFGRKGAEFHEPYLDTLAQHYGTGMFAADFESDPEVVRTAINDWVLEQTNDRIEDLLPMDSLGRDTVLVLVNAIYFKASWLVPFDASLTAPGTFHAPGGDVEAQMMKGDHAHDQYAEGDGWRALSLPYVSPDVRMAFVLPDEGRFEEIEAGFDRAFLDDVLGKISRFSLTDVRIPRFKFEAEVKLKPVLQALGMKQAFELDADLSGIIGNPGDVMVDAVYHKAFVAIDEQGTEAAAATAAVAIPTSLPPPGTFIADRPFLFLVYDQPTGQILFVGRVLDPS